MAEKVGTLIKKARTAAGMTQEQLARKVKGVSASDISRAERGELELSTDALKAIAKATGVTQASLLNAAKKKTSSTSAKKPSATSSSSSMKLTATEKKLVELYRKADAKTKKSVMAKLKNESDDFIDNIVSDVIDNFFKK